ncbi:MAG: ribonuclease P protein component [Candidatus Portnoybacteria bacterium CG10_big_fil_rev_8_21_14_0_10_38_18]|uniref:Ribonuclease P protein component n=1 Tax=Candidatus Portnoybacteria bacterium CG10_big_fil_rev_8_21_14_0_10_38_18 TaxID=1974813 RepID=A0A2M8KCI9_9BACT|nr:MAG: ribonuclease P protein component [Candidatus Portnoybacteria bacterium CG10_big_fil_rev_8_21_14_0_10_38_18]
MPLFTKRFKKADFNNLFEKGKTIAGEPVFLKFRRNNLKNNRFCFVVSLKVSKKSTIRNRIKRQLKNAVRENIKNIKPGLDIAIIAKPGIIGKRYWEIKEEIENLFQKLNLYK